MINSIDKAFAFQEKALALRSFTTWEGVPEKAFDNLVRLGVTLDEKAVQKYRVA